MDMDSMEEERGVREGRRRERERRERRESPGRARRGEERGGGGELREELLVLFRTCV